MAERTIRTGVGTYLGADGIWRHGLFGEDVDVHGDDLERFDRLNPAEPEPEVDSDDDGSDDVPVPAESWKKDELTAYAAEHGVDISGASTKAEILSAIQAAGEQPPADDGSSQE